MVPDEGIEPPTFGLQNRCSTAELIRPGDPGGLLEGANGALIRQALAGCHPCGAHVGSGSRRCAALTKPTLALAPPMTYKTALQTYI
jgi:hypothetical protein